MKQLLVRIGLACIFFAGAMGFVAGEDIIVSLSNPVDIYQECPSDYKKVKAVDTELHLLMDKFVEEETTTGKSGSVTGKYYDYYYVLPVFTEDDIYFAGLKVSSKDSKQYDKLADLTWEYLNGADVDFGKATIPFKGGFRKMDEELYEYFEEWFEEQEYFESEAELEKRLLPLVLEKVNFENGKVAGYGCGICVIVGCVMLLFGFWPAKKKDGFVPTMITIEGVNYPGNNFVSVNRNIINDKKIHAIKELRELTGLGLYEAKNVVDNWNQYWSDTSL